MSASRSPAANRSAAQPSNSTDHPGGVASGDESSRNGRPWVVNPEPMTRTPSSRSGAAAHRGEQPLRVQRRHRDLQHRDVGVRIHHGQRDVRAVVEPAVRVMGDGLVVGHQRLDPGGQLRRARRVIGDVVVVLREAPEVVGQWGFGGGGADRQRRSLPVRRDNQYRPRHRKFVCPRGELRHPELVVDQRRGAVTQVERRRRLAADIRRSHHGYSVPLSGRERVPLSSDS